VHHGAVGVGGSHLAHHDAEARARYPVLDEEESEFVGVA